MRLNVTSLSLFLSLIPAAAFAQDPAASAVAAPAPAANPLAKENWPTSYVDRPLGLSQGMLQVDVPVWVSLSKDAVAKPINVPLAAWYGVSDQLQLGLVHGQFLGFGSGNGLCLTGKDGNCARAYDNLGVNGLYSITGRGSSLELAAWAQVNISSFDPMLVQAQIGGAMNLVVGTDIAILAYPGISVGVTERDSGNKESLFIPVYAYYRAHPNVSPFVTLGLGGSFEKFGDNSVIPAGVGALYAPNAQMDFGVRFDLGSLKTQGNAGVFDSKTIAFWASFRPL